MAKLLTAEQEEFVRTNAEGNGPKIMAELVNAKFGTTITRAQMKGFYHNHKIRSGVTGWFEKGHTPYTKGKTWDEYMSKEAQERSRATTYKDGNVPPNLATIGEIRTTSDGYKIIKTSEEGTQRERWTFLHRYLWEQENGPIPEGHVLTFKDGDKEHCELSNLMLISKSEHQYLNKTHAREYGPEVVDARVYVHRIRDKTRKRGERNEQRENG